MPTVQIKIYGEVQGVFFRATAKSVAARLGIKGWIKNTGEGNVEAVIDGEDKAVEEFIAWCGRGPDKSIVTKVDVSTVPPASFEEFIIIRH